VGADGDLAAHGISLRGRQHGDADHLTIWEVVTKRGRGRGSLTTHRITKAGRAAYERHRGTLRAIRASGSDQSAEAVDDDFLRGVRAR